ncbi:MAG: tetratricopeptide repeat protein [Vampirovibrionales bacterium]
MFPRKPKTTTVQLPGESGLKEKRYASDPAGRAVANATPTRPVTPPDQVRGKNALTSALQKLALNRFMGAQPTTHEPLNALTQPVAHPHKVQWGKAYEWVIMGDARRLNDQPEDALLFYQQASDAQPTYRDAWLGLGLCHTQLQNPTAAISALKKALRLNAFDTEVRLALAKAYQTAHRWSEAHTQYQRLLSIDSDHQEGRFQWALGLEQHGQNEQAIDLYTTILAHDPDCLPALNNLGSLCLRMARYEEAEVHFRLLMDAAPEFHRGFLGLAITLDRAGRSDEALFYYRHVLALKPTGRNTQFITQRIDELHTVVRSPLKRVK